MTMIEVNNLTKRYGPLVAVNNLNLSVAQGEVLGFLGPNGAGKSTTMKMLTGFLAPDEGRITVGGDAVSNNPMATKRRIGYLPEGAPLYGDMTPRAFLTFIAQVRGLNGAARANAIDQAVSRTALEGAMDKPIETLSKGFKRRVGLAQAIVHDPPVLILDEPTDGLDPNQKHHVRELIQSMAADKVVVLSTHILEEVEAVCTRAAIISQGVLVFDGSPDELMSRSKLHNALTLTLSGDDGAAMAGAIAALPGIRAVDVVEQRDADATLQVFPNDSAPIATAVSDLVRDKGWYISALNVERGRLDEVFRDITQGETER